jgi:hypothetical protein
MKRVSRVLPGKAKTKGAFCLIWVKTFAKRDHVVSQITQARLEIGNCFVRRTQLQVNFGGSRFFSKTLQLIPSIWVQLLADADADQ